MESTRIQALLKEYSESHQNSTNKSIHWVCVPLIFFSIFGILRAIPSLQVMDDISLYFNWANLILLAVLIYYLRLSLPLFFGFILWAGMVSIGNEYLLSLLGNTGLLLTSITIFILAWIGQFVGHGIEGKKPSFLKDLQFLLIGPAWLMNFILKVVDY